MNLDEIIQDMIEVGRRLDQLGFVPATDGNISVRLGPREIVATASGCRKGRLTPKDFVVIDPEGQRLRGAAKVSTEIQMHLQIYRDRPDAGAVVHAHPPTATGFATAGIPLHQCVLPEVVATIGAVPLAPYATPSTRELPDSIRPFLPDHDALLLANHGAVTFGADLFTAACRMETVEQFAKILFVARTLGQVNLLTPGQVDSINAIRGRYGFEGAAPACSINPDPRVAAPPSAADAPGPPGGGSSADSSGAPDPDLVRRIADQVLRALRPGDLPTPAGAGGPAASAAPTTPAAPPAAPPPGGPPKSLY